MSAAREAVKAILTFAELQCGFSQAAERLGAPQAADEYLEAAEVAEWAAWRIAVASGEKDLIDLMAPWGNAASSAS